ncbi:reverse transcriptase [Gossypium australe]|uniref:Reverse transcriptase n=1 Tax=Gossypium australe TaxID=47621 RepID=A0A5B6W626_9ROSI|nr:reverse transcriptase [Gossypium australe]
MRRKLLIGRGNGLKDKRRNVTKKLNKIQASGSNKFKINGSPKVLLKESMNHLAKNISKLVRDLLGSNAPLGDEEIMKGSAIPEHVSRNFIRAFREYNTDHRPDIVCLLKPRVSGKKANCIIDQLGFNFSHRVEAVGFSGGIWVGWKDPDRSKRKILWEGLKSAMPPQSTPWILMGDFNAILDSEDKRSPSTIGTRCKLFGNFVDSCGLQDLGFSGPKFTWQRGGTSVRLDRALANDAWMEAFPQCLMSNLPRIKSDHRPILLSTRTDMDLATGRPFRFLASWTKHNNFSTFVKDKWIYGGNMAESLNRFTVHTKEWNKKVYRFLGSRKRKLMRSLNNIQKALDHTDSRFLAKKEMEIRDELETNCSGVKRQDATSFIWEIGTLSSSTAARSREGNSTILLIYCSDQDILRSEAVRFFENLYSEEPQDMGELPNIRFPILQASEITFLKREVTVDEIKRALFDMAPLKAPGSDGFHAHFFQSQWDIIGNDICNWVKGVFAGQMINQDLNNTLIILIPKKECPEDFSQFRPISLCSVLYKLVMKVIANRFKLVFPNIISQEQAGFIVGRNITNNIILAQEVILSMRCKRNGKNWVLSNWI